MLRHRTPNEKRVEVLITTARHPQVTRISPCIPPRNVQGMALTPTSKHNHVLRLRRQIFPPGISQQTTFHRAIYTMHAIFLVSRYIPRRYLEERRRCGRHATNDPIVAKTLAKVIDPNLPFPVTTTTRQRRSKTHHQKEGKRENNRTSARLGK